MVLGDLVFGKSIPAGSTFSDPGIPGSQLLINSEAQWQSYLRAVGEDKPVILQSVRNIPEPYGGLFSVVPVCDFTVPYVTSIFWPQIRQVITQALDQDRTRGRSAE